MSETRPGTSWKPSPGWHISANDSHIFQPYLSISLTTVALTSTGLNQKRKMFISEKIRCRYYNLGFCKYLKKGCEFNHPKVNCERPNCDYKTCTRRHNKSCKYYLN